MKNRTKTLLGYFSWTMMTAGLVLLASPRIAFAYLDPGSGSYILQLLLGALFGATFVIKVYWRKIKSFLNGIFLKDSRSDSGDD